jgi:ribosomal protein S18 acetylase RimI-like enzyme
MTAPEPTTLRPASPADAELVFRVTESTIRAYAEAIWGYWDSERTRASFSPCTHHIVQLGSTDIGCLEWVEEPDEFHLNKLYILPAYQNRGFGGQILNNLIAQARKALKPIHLSVLAVNPAQAFYTRHGFRAERRTPERTFMAWRP